MPGSKVSVLLGSGGIATEDRRETYRSLASTHFSGCETVLFVPYASDDHDGYTSRMQGFLGEEGPSLVGIHTCEDQPSAISEADGIYVGGGNSFLLIRDLHEMGLIGPINPISCRSLMRRNEFPPPTYIPSASLMAERWSSNVWMPTRLGPPSPRKPCILEV